MQYLDYEKLDVYRVAMDLVLEVETLAGNMPPGRTYLADQLRRASTSIVLNIAEGAGEHAPAEKSRFYRMAKRSAVECASSVEICLRLQLTNEKSYRQIREQVIRISAMLTKMMHLKTVPREPYVPVPVPMPLPSSLPPINETLAPADRGE